MYRTEPPTDKTIREVVHEIPAEWLPVRCETKRPAGSIGQDCRACARNVCQEPSEVNNSREPGIADDSVKCLAHPAQTSFCKRILAAAFTGAAKITIFIYASAFRGKMKQQVQYTLKKGVIRESNSPWSVSAIFVPKRSLDGKLQYRFCVDFPSSKCGNQNFKTMGA